MVAGTDGATGTERAIVVVMMESIAVMPVPVMCPASVYIPPARIIIPIPRRCPCVPVRSPEPVVYNRSIDIYRLDDIVGSIDVFVAHYLYFHLVFLVFLHIYRGYILVDILCQNSLKNYQTLVAFAGLYYAQVINLPVAVQIQITERAVGVVQHRLELFQVLSLRKQLSYDLQIESFRDVRTVGRYSDCFLCP